MGDSRDTNEGDREIDLVFEWHQLCHACGERKWFSGLICDECRNRHRV
ncbi:hypothetical protein SAMN05192552_101613 [Natrinema hispanicum]|uniref:Uncharacterized protein n=1 Tax=Natrinema hispanicum TaxID=392421 RepID=A0A1G6T2Z4_9EURY|nr:hypothetical protein SAMN05192552_101613 [Natrinema hispanicum]SEU00289.1 hypothetical protein SAMN04488694_12520 [Natrinema hispanicum]